MRGSSGPGGPARVGTTAYGELGHAVGVLREVAGYDLRSDPRRAEVTSAQASLLEACARHWGELPAEVTTKARRVAAAVDHATGHRLAED